MNCTNYTQRPQIPTTGCWETIRPPLAALCPQNTLQEINCRVWVEAEPWSPLKAHQNCNKNPLFEMKLSNCYFTPTDYWSSLNYSPLTLFQMEMLGFLWEVGESWLTLLPGRQKYGRICTPEGLDMTAEFQDCHNQKRQCLPTICHPSSPPSAQRLELLMCKGASYLELVL